MSETSPQTNDDLVNAIQDLNDPAKSALFTTTVQSMDINAVVDTFICSQNQQLAAPITALLDAIKKAVDIQRFCKELIEQIADKVFRNKLLLALGEHIKNNPWQTAFFVVGIVLIANPLALAGFGALGPVAGSIAAGWQASIGGSIAAGSAFAVLQSWGMLYAVAIPAIGGVVAGTAAVGLAAKSEVVRQGVEDSWVVANAGGKHFERWAKGEYGKPVEEWWNGRYGNPVSEWWGGAFGNPVSDWAAGVAKKHREDKGEERT